MNISKKLAFTGIGFLFIFWVLYISIAYSIDWGNDIYDHSVIAKEMLTGERPLFGGPFILYVLSLILSFFSENIFKIMTAVCLLLGVATTLKLLISTKEIYKIQIYKDNNNFWFSLIISLSLLIIIPIPIFYFSHGTFYIGNFLANVWHNSTVIFLMPFAILLFLTSYKQIQSYNKRRDIIILILIILNIFIKPSFFFAFICAYPLMMLFKYKFSTTFWRSLLPIIIGGIFVGLQYWLIYQLNNLDLANTPDSKIGIGFFNVYNANVNMKYLPIALLISYLFPIVYSVFNAKRLKNNIAYYYVVTLTFFSLAIYGVFFESGPRFMHGNFYWQIVPCTWLLFFVLVVCLLKDIKREGFSRKNMLLIFIYSIYVVFGLLYLVRILTKHIYL